jgi:hypothetical protein
MTITKTAKEDITNLTKKHVVVVQGATKNVEKMRQQMA